MSPNFNKTFQTTQNNFLTSNNHKSQPNVTLVEPQIKKNSDLKFHVMTVLSRAQRLINGGLMGRYFWNSPVRVSGTPGQFSAA